MSNKTLDIYDKLDDIIHEKPEEEINE